MTGHVVIGAPLRVEASRLSPAFAPGVVIHSGPGPRRARRVGRSAAFRSADGVAVAGIAGGVSADVAAGDVVVATEVRGPEETIRCPGAKIIAAALRRRGLPVHTGPMVSVARVVVRRRERDRLARAGALCVDTESAWLLADPAQRAVACVRVVADAPPESVIHPATVRKLRAALDRLPDVADALAEWAAAVHTRMVLLAAPRSFCAGVERAIDVVERALASRGAPVYVRKQIVHNTHVVRRLAEKGAIFVDDLTDVPPGATVVFSAHGVSPAVRAAADRQMLDVIDATCPLVTKVHNQARRIAARGDTILLIGHRGHEEADGTVGEAPDHIVLVEDPADAARVQVPDPARVSYLIQTTLAADAVQDVVDVLRERFPALRDPPGEDICYATTNRQNAVRAVCQRSDLMLVVGSANSSNSQRLVEVAERTGTPAYLIDDVDDIDLRWLAQASTVGITAGASAPPGLVADVLDALRSLGRVEVAEHAITTEDVHFTLPKEVRAP